MELTLDNVYQLLDSTEYTIDYLTPDYSGNPIKEKKFSLTDYTDTMKLLMDSLWPGYRIRYIDDPKAFLKGAMVKLDTHYEKKMFLDVTKIQFKYYYPYAIYRLNNIQPRDNDPYDEENWDDDVFFKHKLLWNIDKFPILYNFIFENKNEIKKRSERVYKLVKMLLNFTFGMMNNKFSLIKCQNTGEVTESIRNIPSYFNDNYPNHIIYIDCDTMYFSAFNEIEDEIVKKLQGIGVEYEIEKFKYFFPIFKHIYITSETDLKMRGIKTISNLRIYKEKQKNIREKIESKKHKGVDIDIDYASGLFEEFEIEYDDNILKNIIKKEIRNVQSTGETFEDLFLDL